MRSFILASFLMISSRAFQVARVASRPTFMRAMSTVPEDQKPMYALGINLAKQIGGQFRGLIDTNGPEMDAVIQGFKDTMKDELTEEPNAFLAKHGPELNNILQERAGSVVDKMKADGEDFITNFLDVNPEAVKTDSGIVYLEMVAGTGESPKIENTVEVHYHGQLTDGTVFDSSVQRGQTISFPLGNVIKGWQEGLQLMKEGGKATLVIPSELGYGDQGSGETIPPGATLKFEVELFKILSDEVEVEFVN